MSDPILPPDGPAAASDAVEPPAVPVVVPPVEVVPDVEPPAAAGVSDDVTEAAALEDATEPAAAASPDADDALEYVPRPADALTGEQPRASEGGRAARRHAAEEAARSQAAVSRRRALLVSGGVLGLLVLLLLGVFVLGRSRGGDGAAQPTSSPSASDSTKQPTLLIQIRTTNDGIAVDNALTSVGGSVKTANLITIPPTTVVDVATGGTLPFGEIARLPDPNGSANALSDAIGVNVDGTFAMDTLAFSGLVDAVGGVTADVDVPVMVTQADGQKVVLVPAGPNQVLQGPQAAAFATYLAPGEPEAARTARFVTILERTLAKLPDDPAKVEAIINGLGASARSTIPAPDLATYLLRLKANVKADDVAYNALPVQPIDTGGTITAYRIDNAAAAAMVKKYLPDAVRTPGPNSKVRVLVQNGVGTPGLNAAARQDLVDAGFAYVNGGNAATFGHAKTQIIVPDATADSLAWGADVASALKVPSTAVAVSATGPSIADVIVVLGADFKPGS